MNTNKRSKSLIQWVPVFAACIVSGLVVHLCDKLKMTVTDTHPFSISLRNQSTAVNIEDPNPLATWPRIVWLMSFPNSGTTFTTELVYTMTNMTTATNYGLETVADSHGQHGIPVLKDSRTGPFWKFPDWEKPTRYVMTKTHCGGRCTACRPESYIETVRSFSVACRTGSFVQGHNRTRIYAAYNESIAQRAIHLIRNPFDNLVSRLHMERKNWGFRSHGREKEISSRLSAFTSDKAGLKAWCAYIHEARAREEEESRFYDEEITALSKGLPCHAEFFRYVQWHNMAHEVTNSLKLPTLTLFYENYTTNFDESVKEVLDFLELPVIHAAPEFISGKHYESYFEPEECRAAAQLAKLMASPKTWSSIRHYFEHWL